MGSFYLKPESRSKMRRLWLVIMLCALGFPALATEMPFRGLEKLNTPVDASLARLQDPSGATITVQKWQGAWVLLNVWATWCAPCVAELPTLDRFARTHTFPNLTVIGVSVDANAQPGRIQQFLQMHNIGRFAGYLDSDTMVQELFNASGLPMTYLLNPQGVAVAQYRGGANWLDPKVAQDVKRFMSSGKTANKSPTKP